MGWKNFQPLLGYKTPPQRKHKTVIHQGFNMLVHLAYVLKVSCNSIKKEGKKKSLKYCPNFILDNNLLQKTYSVEKMTFYREADPSVSRHIFRSIPRSFCKSCFSLIYL